MSSPASSFPIPLARIPEGLRAEFAWIATSSAGALCQRLLATPQEAGGRARLSRWVAMFAGELSPELVRVLFPLRPEILSAHPRLGAELWQQGFRALLEAPPAPALLSPPEAQLAEFQNPLVPLRTSLMVALRREVLSPDAWSLEEVERRCAQEEGEGEGLRRFLRRLGKAREEGAGSPAELSRALLPAYIHQDRTLEGGDEAGRLAAIHPYCQAEDILRLVERYDSEGIAEALGTLCGKGSRTFLEHPALRQHLRGWVHREAVAVALALNPRPEDFPLAVESLRQRAGGRDRLLRILLDERVPAQALGWLAESLRLQILGSPDPELRLKAIRGQGIPAGNEAGAPPIGGRPR